MPTVNQSPWFWKICKAQPVLLKQLSSAIPPAIRCAGTQLRWHTEETQSSMANSSPSVHQSPFPSTTVLSTPWPRLPKASGSCLAQTLPCGSYPSQAQGKIRVQEQAEGLRNWSIFKSCANPSIREQIISETAQKKIKPHLKAEWISTPTLQYSAFLIACRSPTAPHARGTMRDFL